LSFALALALLTPLILAGGMRPGTASAQDSRVTEKPVLSSNPFSGDADAILEGNKLYFKWCAGCHGENADGVSRFGAYAGNLTKFWRGYAEFIAIAIKGRSENMMPPWGGILDTIQLSKIGAFLETKAGKEANWK
jgi:mono/diheme cytochrome c family protein